jgi:hypothetical protein
MSQQRKRTMSHSSALALRLASSASWPNLQPCSYGLGFRRRVHFIAVSRHCARRPTRALRAICRLLSGEFTILDLRFTISVHLAIVNPKS